MFTWIRLYNYTNNDQQFNRHNWHTRLDRFATNTCSRYNEFYLTHMNTLKCVVITKSIYQQYSRTKWEHHVYWIVGHCYYRF